MSDPKLLYLGAATGRNHFSNVPMEFVIPPNCPVVFVADLFLPEYGGGAELTTEAIIQASPWNVFRVHSQSLSIEMLDRYKDRYWVVGNFTQCDAAALAHLAEGGFKYSVMEFDYKYCMYRSEVLHQKEAGHPCDCPLRPHGILVETLYANAQHVFWMSAKQKEHFLSRIPSLIFCEDNHHIVLGSVFTEEAIDKMLELRALHEASVKQLPIKIWAVQGSQNWIKGTQETLQWCTSQKMAVKVLQSGLAYETFLMELAKCSGLVFHPLDFDTCPRVVIEARVMGLDVDLNANVQHADETWFSEPVDDIVAKLRSDGNHFWSYIHHRGRDKAVCFRHLGIK